jgi:hypothetical protein
MKDIAIKSTGKKDASVGKEEVMLNIFPGSKERLVTRKRSRLGVALLNTSLITKELSLRRDTDTF